MQAWARVRSGARLHAGITRSPGDGVLLVIKAAIGLVALRGGVALRVVAVGCSSGGRASRAATVQVGLIACAAGHSARRAVHGVPVRPPPHVARTAWTTYAGRTCCGLHMPARGPPFRRPPSAGATRPIRPLTGGSVRAPAFRPSLLQSESMSPSTSSVLRAAKAKGQAMLPATACETRDRGVLPGTSGLTNEQGLWR